MREQKSENGVTIEQLNLSDWQEYKQLRLYALQTDPQAFSSTYARESAYSDEKWQQRVQSASEGKNSWMYFARQRGKLVGMIGGYRDENDQKNHTAQIWGVFVSPDQRGKGISKKLMATLIDRLSQNPDINTLKLEVNTDQKSASKLYESFGFTTTKTISIQLGDGQLHEVTEMEKSLVK